MKPFPTTRAATCAAIVMCIAALACSACCGNAAPEVTPTPTGPPASEKIAFVSLRDGNSEVYVMDADGSNQTNLSNNAADDFFPAWSPDGSRMLFVTDRNTEPTDFDGNWEVYVMQADGTGQRNLCNNPDYNWMQCWSPDGAPRSLGVRSTRSHTR